MDVSPIFAIDLLPELNPLKILENALDDLFDGLLDSFYKVFIDPPTPTPGKWEDYLYGEAIGLAGTLSLTVCIILCCLMVFFHQKIKSFGVAVVALIAITAAYPVLFAIYDFLIVAGDDLARAMHWYKPEDKEFANLPEFGNVLGSILGLASVTVTGGILVGVFVIYEIIIVLVKFFLPIALVLAPLGERARKFLSWMISLGLVTMVLGRPLAIFAVDAGRMFAEQINAANNGFVKTVCITVALILAIILQGILIWVTHKVTSNVVGRTYSKVFGHVDTHDKERKDMAVGGLDSHLQSKTAVPVFIADPPSEPAQSGSAARNIGGAVVMQAMTKIHPAVAAAAAARKAKE